MATEVLRAHNIILPPQRIRASTHRKPSSTGNRRSPAAGARTPTAGRRHLGRKTAAPVKPAPEVYAGPAFSASPEPSSLPLPQFPVKKAAAVVDDAATRDLRRILRLE
ncbi:uncharacterized protein LOC133901672 [Phragmites australis]|uniref:uncharacterized protein LOC133901672 n=1 Tax=Phragmites australis TaxID=29695 RepID=UPI002D78296D|nr:uncharacterized protein LOC133901672 [Phragmites australis]